MFLFCGVLKNNLYLQHRKQNDRKMDTGGKDAVIDVHVSVDCVLIGFDGVQFRVLLVSQVGRQPDENLNMQKLPGSLRGSG